MANVFFTSDLHLDHENMVDFRNKVHNKSWSNANDVNQWLLEQWNSRVRSKDLVWVLGDISWSKSGLEWLALMNGTKRLILGNHDTEMLHVTDMLPYFESIHSVVKKYGVVMTHVPIHTESLEYRWDYNMHGHIHDKDQDIKDPRYLNVNVDVRDGIPLSLDEVRKEIYEANKVSTDSL